MKMYKCSICGYVYDESNNDKSFAELDDSWVCPLCSAPKNMFEQLMMINLKPSHLLKRKLLQIH